MEISSIWDNEGETFDRYTVVTTEEEHLGLNAALGLSHNPQSPQGFSQWTTAQEGKHLGKRVKFEDLSKHLQEHITGRLS